MNVTSARIDLKIACGRAERLLERYAEPLTALHGDGLAGAPARAGLAAGRRQLRPRLDLRLLARRGRRPGADPVRGSGADRSGRAVADARRDRAAGPDRQLGRDQPLARRARGPRRVRRRRPAGMGVGRAALRRPPHPDPGSGRADPVVADLKLHGSEIPELFRRRRHGRELFGRQINSIDIEPDHPDGTPLVRVFADDIADPPELDVEELLGAGRGGRPGPAGRGVAAHRPRRERRRILARVADARARLGDDRGRRRGGAGRAGPEPVANAVVAGERRLDNGLVAVEVARRRHVPPGGRRRRRSTASGGSSTAATWGQLQLRSAEPRRRSSSGPRRSRSRRDRPARSAAGSTSGAASTGRSGSTPRERVRTRGHGPDRRHHDARAPGRRAVRPGRGQLREPVARPPGPLPRAARRARRRGSAAEGQYAVVERGLEVEGGHGEVPLADLPGAWLRPDRGRQRRCSTTSSSTRSSTAASWRSRCFARSAGSAATPTRTARTRPVRRCRCPAAQLIGERSMRFALMPHAGSWVDGRCRRDGRAVPARRARRPRDRPGGADAAPRRGAATAQGQGPTA